MDITYWTGGIIDLSIWVQEGDWVQAENNLSNRVGAPQIFICDISPVSTRSVSAVTKKGRISVLEGNWFEIWKLCYYLIFLLCAHIKRSLSYGVFGLWKFAVNGEWKIKSLGRTLLTLTNYSVKSLVHINQQSVLIWTSVAQLPFNSSRIYCILSWRCPPHVNLTLLLSKILHFQDRMGTENK